MVFSNETLSIPLDSTSTYLGDLTILADDDRDLQWVEANFDAMAEANLKGEDTNPLRPLNGMDDAVATLQ